MICCRNSSSSWPPEHFALAAVILTARIVTRNKWRREMIRRGAARDQQTGKWERGEPPKKPKAWEVNDRRRGGSRRILLNCRTF